MQIFLRLELFKLRELVNDKEKIFIKRNMIKILLTNVDLF